MKHLMKNVPSPPGRTSWRNFRARILQREFHPVRKCPDFQLQVATGLILVNVADDITRCLVDGHRKAVDIGRRHTRTFRTEAHCRPQEVQQPGLAGNDDPKRMLCFRHESGSHAQGQFEPGAPPRGCLVGAALVTCSPTILPGSLREINPASEPLLLIRRNHD